MLTSLRSRLTSFLPICSLVSILLPLPATFAVAERAQDDRCA